MWAGIQSSQEAPPLPVLWPRLLCQVLPQPGSSAKIWNAEGGSGLQQMLYLLHEPLRGENSACIPCVQRHRPRQLGILGDGLLRRSLGLGLGLLGSPQRRRRHTHCDTESDPYTGDNGIQSVWPVALHVISFCQNKDSLRCQLSLPLDSISSVNRWFWICLYIPPFPLKDQPKTTFLHFGFYLFTEQCAEF